MLRIGRGVCAVRRSFEDRRDRAQERHATAAPRQSDAAARPYAGGHAQRDRAAESGHRLVSRARASQVRRPAVYDRRQRRGILRSTTMPMSASVWRRATRSRPSSSTSRAPTSRSEGETFGCDPDLTARSCDAARATTNKTLIVKLSPKRDRYRRRSRVEAENSGADALAVINTVRGMAIDVETWRPRLGNVTGGLSGPAIRPIAVLAVYEVARAVSIPIVGQGGIETLTRRTRVFPCRRDGNLDRNGELHRPADSRAYRRRSCKPYLARRNLSGRFKKSLGRQTSDSRPHINTKEMKVDRNGTTDRRPRRPERRGCRTARRPALRARRHRQDRTRGALRLSGAHLFVLRGARRANVRRCEAARHPANRRRRVSRAGAPDRAHASTCTRWAAAR